MLIASSLVEDREAQLRKSIKERTPGTIRSIHEEYSNPPTVCRRLPRDARPLQSRLNQSQKCFTASAIASHRSGYPAPAALSSTPRSNSSKSSRCDVCNGSIATAKSAVKTIWLTIVGWLCLPAFACRRRERAKKIGKSTTAPAKKPRRAESVETFAQSCAVACRKDRGTLIFTRR